MKTFKLLLGFAAGAILGLAFAPKKGSELRKEVAEGMQNNEKMESTIKNNAAVIGRDIATTAQEIYQDPKVQAKIQKSKQEAYEMLKNLGEEVKQKAGSLATDAKKNIKEMIDQYSDCCDQKCDCQEPCEDNCECEQGCCDPDDSVVDEAEGETKSSKSKKTTKKKSE